MALLEWDDKYSLNINLIDNQHKKMFAMMNNLHNSINRNETHHVIAGLFEALIEYTKEHFSSEEKIFQESGYPGLENHKNLHQQLTREVIKLQGEYKKGSDTISYDTLEFLLHWIAEHIQKRDQEYSQFLNLREEQKNKV